MKLVRYEKNGITSYGALFGQTVRRVAGDIFGKFDVTDEACALDSVRLLAPVSPPNILAIGLNYGRHAGESGMKPPERPLIFLKATSSIAAHGDAILLPEAAPDEVDYEAELTCVIGKTAKNVSEEDALGYVLGFTCGNDVSARDCQLRQDAQWARGKSFDTFCPIGPCIETEVPDPDNLKIRSLVNGTVMQSSNTQDMIFSVRKLVSYCSKNMTLLPGTLIMTGTPDGVGFARTPPVFLRAGDVVEIEIEGLDTLRNTVK
ncbi:MAG: fumarylacetoacetate hydrolase family protein [Clostridiales bacterium]|jgi:2-keto-4-pentenoate hydratase/2-oxohepta-3-ene-1,7-dioic acid hydratase in catechol pathway|nr:fumarylacetoacetate hydrolase family protein [Clostridiales bacterium]